MRNITATEILEREKKIKLEADEKILGPLLDQMLEIVRKHRIPKNG